LSWQVLLVLVALLVMLTIVGFGLGAGQPRLPGALPEPPPWLQRLGSLLDTSRPVRLDEITGCTLRGRVLHMPGLTGTVTCDVVAADADTRKVRLRLTRGRVRVRARIRGEQPVEVEAELPGDDGETEGSLRIEAGGARLVVRCRGGPCELVFDEPEDP
jgi:hypothetical protein